MSKYLFLMFFSSFCFASNLSIAWENAPRTIDPRFTTDANSHYLADLTHCGLINFSQDGKIIPSLASSWSWLSPTKIRFNIKPNIRYSDGSKVSLKDIKETYMFFKRDDLKKPSPLKAAYRQITQISINKNTVTFELKEADTSFLQNFVMGILPEKLAKKEHHMKPQVGCGPFKLLSKKSNELKLVKNKNYNLGSLSTIENLTIKISPDEQTRFSKLVKGEVDLVQNGISRDKIKLIAKKYPQLKITTKPALNTTYLGFNTKHKVLSKPNIRRAIALGINRDVIIKYILSGLASKANTLITPQDIFYNSSVPATRFDPKFAEELIKKEGFKKKPYFKISYKTTTNTTRVSIAQAIASQLKKIGIEVKVEALEWGKLKEDVIKGRTHMWGLSWVGFKDPDIYRHAFATSSFYPNGGNRGFYSNPDLDKLFEKAKIATNFKTRKKLYDQIQLKIASEMPYAFLWHEHNYAVYQKRLKGYKVYADGRYSSIKDVIVK